MSNIYDYRKSTASKTQRMDVSEFPKFHRKASLAERLRSLGWGVFLAALALVCVFVLAYVATHENGGWSSAVSGSDFPSVIPDIPSP